eukprot:7002362-Pyramimonas_sp.AAC.1
MHRRGSTDVVDMHRRGSTDAVDMHRRGSTDVVDMHRPARYRGRTEGRRVRTVTPRVYCTHTLCSLYLQLRNVNCLPFAAQCSGYGTPLLTQASLKDFQTGPSVQAPSVEVPARPTGHPLCVALASLK